MQEVSLEEKLSVLVSSNGVWKNMNPGIISQRPQEYPNQLSAIGADGMRAWEQKHS